MPEMHPIFQKFTRMIIGPDPRYSYNFLGVKTRKTFVEGVTSDPASSSTPLTSPSIQGAFPVNYPAFDEEYWEWIDLLESVVGAEEKFVMMELGAGYGRWLVNAALAARQYHGETFSLYLVGVEAEPTHFEWMKQHFIDNGLDPSQHRLVHNAVDNRHHEVEFYVSHPELKGAAEWYGQAIVESPRPAAGFGTMKIHTVTLRNLLQEVEFVNLIDMDLQGKEYDVVEDAIDDLCHKAGRLHIGTHWPIIEWKLRRLLRKRGWKCVADFGIGARPVTEYGEIVFGDGVQSWMNPHFPS